MAWNDRIREAAYTSPTGRRFVFGYENVSKSVEKKTTAFEFPDANGTYIQDLGHSGRRYPLRIFFWGDDYDLQADDFESGLIEIGTGKLDHPIYGSIDVVPFGKISRRDDLKTASNQTIIQVEFWETIDLIYPTAQADGPSDVLTAVSSYNDAASSEFDRLIELSSAVDQASFKNTYLALLDQAKSGLQAVADTQGDVQRQFNIINDSINNGIDILISEPITMALQTIQFVQSPARALTSIAARLSAYKGLVDSIILGDNSIVSPSIDNSSSNAFHTKDLYVSSYVSGEVVSVVNNQFETKTDAIFAADVLLAQMDAVTEWRDDNFSSLEEVDTGESYRALQSAVAVAAGFLVEISFSLKQERSRVIDRNRTIVDFAAEVYGEVDPQLDFIITSNNLTGSEVLELPKGKEIVYYI